MFEFKAICKDDEGVYKECTFDQSSFSGDDPLLLSDYVYETIKLLILEKYSKTKMGKDIAHNLCRDLDRLEEQLRKQYFEYEHKGLFEGNSQLNELFSRVALYLNDER